MEEIEFLEKQIIGFFIIREETHKYIKQLSEDFFITSKCKTFYRVIKELYLEKQEINLITINNKLSTGLQNKGAKVIKNICDITDAVVVYSSIEESINKLKDIHLRAKILKLISKVNAEIKDPLSDITNIKKELQEELNNLKSDNEVNYGESMQDVLCKTLDLIEEKNKKGDDLSLYTGFFKLDTLTDGLHENELTCIGARPGTGKTAFALQIAMNVAYKNKKVFYSCLEMSPEQLMHRILANQCRINSQFLRNGRVKKEEFEKIGQNAPKILDLNLKLDTKSRYIEEIENIAHTLKDRDELDVLIIDYLTLLKTKQKFSSRELEVADISRRLKLLALELHIPIIILVQLNRDAENKVPTMANIRESGSIEQNCDNIIFLYNEETDESNVQMIDVILEKQRQGATGTLKLKFNKAFSNFSNPT